MTNKKYVDAINAGITWQRAVQSVKDLPFPAVIGTMQMVVDLNEIFACYDEYSYVSLTSQNKYVDPAYNTVIGGYLYK